MLPYHIRRSIYFLEEFLKLLPEVELAENIREIIKDIVEDVLENLRNEDTSEVWDMLETVKLLLRGVNLLELK